MVETYLKPLKAITDKKDEIEASIQSMEAKAKLNPFFQTLFGVEHQTLPQAILADIIDVLPILGEVSNVSRIRLAESKSRRLLQGTDLAVDTLPQPLGKIADLFLPSNTIWFIEQEIKRSK